MTDSLQRRTGIAIEAARTAGALLLQHARAGVQAEHKGRIDLVTEADRAAEALIREHLSASLPEDLVVGEEGESVPEAQAAGHERWYVDPLDGTTNFIAGNSRWAVSLGWADSSNVLQVGVVFVPDEDIMFVARRGAGAWSQTGAGLQRQRLAVTRPAALQEAVVASGFPYDLHNGPTNLAEWCAVTLRARSMRSLGAAAVELCDVACGRLDAFWEQRLGRWDTAAGIVIAAEAGATVTNLEGDPVVGPSTSVVVAGPGVHPELLKCLQEAAPRPARVWHCPSG